MSAAAYFGKGSAIAFLIPYNLRDICGMVLRRVPGDRDVPGFMSVFQKS